MNLCIMHKNCVLIAEKRLKVWIILTKNSKNKLKSLKNTKFGRFFLAISLKPSTAFNNGGQIWTQHEICFHMSTNLTILPQLLKNRWFFRTPMLAKIQRPVKKIAQHLEGASFFFSIKWPPTKIKCNKNPYILNVRVVRHGCWTNKVWGNLIKSIFPITIS